MLVKRFREILSRQLHGYAKKHYLKFIAPAMNIPGAANESAMSTITCETINENPKENQEQDRKIGEYVDQQDTTHTLMLFPLTVTPCRKKLCRKKREC